MDKTLKILDNKMEDVIFIIRRRDEILYSYAKRVRINDIKVSSFV